MKREIDFPKNLKRLRKKAGLTRNALAKKLSYSEKSIEKWESGDSTPPLSVICTLSEIFCVPLDTLIYKDKREIEYYLGIDGGGTKTAFLLENRDGKQVAFCELGSSNPNDIGIDACEKVLKNGILEVCQDIDCSRIAVFAGIAGGGLSGDNATHIKKILSGFGFGYVDNGSDIDNAIELTLEQNDGITLIAGTGIIAFAIKGSKRIRCGGWGYLIDSAGSGYNFGRDALEAAFMSIDGRVSHTILKNLVEKHVKMPLPDAIPMIYAGGKRYIASLAPLVFEAADLGDKCAVGIISRNCEYIANMLNRALENFEDKSIPVVICGGLANYGDVLDPIIQKHLKYQVDLRFTSEPMVHGAVSRARRLSSKIVDGKVK